MLAQLTIHLDGIESLIPVADNQTLLDAAQAAGIELPHICRRGSCSACAVMLIAGRVTMNDCKALSKRDRDSGLILACQAIPETETLTISYD
jgi:3-ketosteroid 9alpha-monooxygenase subunit B